MSVNVTSAEFQRSFGRYREAAMKAPVTITHHGRDSLVLVAADEYRRLKQRDREVLLVTDLTAEDIAALEAVRFPDEAHAFDHELTS